jgi:hypothetical protein
MTGVVRATGDREDDRQPGAEAEGSTATATKASWPSSPQTTAKAGCSPRPCAESDYGLGQDERAREHQPVAGRLGPRFYDWQLAQSVNPQR